MYMTVCRPIDDIHVFKKWPVSQVPNDIIRYDTVSSFWKSTFIKRVSSVQNYWKVKSIIATKNGYVHCQECLPELDNISRYGLDVT